MELDFHLDNDICDEIISRFESDERKSPGVTGQGLIPEIKDSIDLSITNFKEWNDISEKLEVFLKDGIQKYKEWISAYVSLKYTPLNNPSKFSGFQVQKSGKYIWHTDNLIDKNMGFRIFTYMWYLNDVETGGETDFIYKKIKPKKGKLVIFPSTWTYIHSGLETKNKYVLIGFCYN